jgi:hypothetical protein
MKTVIRALGPVFLGLVLVAAYSFFTDDSAVESRARALSCAGRGPKCVSALARLEKTPLWRDLQFKVGRDMVTVHCTRIWILLGEHRCAVTSPADRR